MRQLLAFLALALATVVHASVPTGSVDAFVEREMAASGIPGVSYATVENGEIDTLGARGVMREGGRNGIKPDTPFLAGSISKSFTALAAMQLAEAGKLDLDTGVGEYLDSFTGQPAGAITLRQLLSHTSGYSTYQGNSSRTDGDTGEDGLAIRVDRLAEAGPDGAPGANWEYSNANYLIAGRVVEAVSGQDYAAYVTANILEPLGMRHSLVADGTIHPEVATGHTPWFGGKRPIGDYASSRAMAPAGGIIASAGDLARYLQAMMNGEDDILSAAGKAEMIRPASDASPFYGLGWFVDTESGTVWHGGTSVGTETLATMIPAQQKAVVVLANAGSGMGFRETAPLLDGVTARALGLDYDGPENHWGQKSLFAALALLPLAYLVSIVWAWRHRAAIRAKRTAGAFGRFSLWFPLLTTLVGAWAILWLMPWLLGAPLSTVRVFSPDLGLVLVASAVTGVVWAVFRLGVAYTGRPHRT